MDLSVHRSPSVGSLVKKIMNVNPGLSVHEIIGLVRQATRTQDASAGDYANVQFVDEAQALKLAKATLSNATPKEAKAKLK